MGKGPFKSLLPFVGNLALKEALIAKPNPRCRVFNPAKWR